MAFFFVPSFAASFGQVHATRQHALTSRRRVWQGPAVQNEELIDPTADASADKAAARKGAGGKRPDKQCSQQKWGP